MAPAGRYVERLLETVLSEETSRVGMAVDVLTKWLHEPRAIVPLTMLLDLKADPYPLVLAARGLARLGDPQAVPALAELLLDENKPFVARIAAAEALGDLGGENARRALEQATASPRPSVAKASARVLKQFQTNHSSSKGSVP
jgi:HEAT repeat protein